VLLEVVFLEVLGEVADEEAEVVFGPLGEGRVGPGFAGCGSDVDFAVVVVGGSGGGIVGGR